MAKIALCADMHCGSVSGIGGIAAFDEWLQAAIKRNQPFTHVIANGDLIDGPQRKSNQRGLIVRSLSAQCSMAAKAINLFGAHTVAITRGTPYHTDDGDTWEDTVLKEVAARKKIIDDRLEMLIDGIILDVRHFQGRAATYAKKEQNNNRMWATRRDGQHKAQIIVRSHLHDYFATTNRHGMYLSLPGLQLQGSPHGDLKCSDEITTGFIVVETTGNGGYRWHAEIAELPQAKMRLHRL